MCWSHSAGYTFAQVRRFARLLAERIEAEIPALATTQHRIGKRRGKVYLDYMRNAIGQTAAAPYSLRPWPGATVSTPLEWREVARPNCRQEAAQGLSCSLSELGKATRIGMRPQG
jgi:DNA primase